MKNNFESVINNMSGARDVVFVVGSPRSGTGVIARSIGASHDLCYLGETGAFSSVLFGSASLRQILRLVTSSGWLKSNLGMFSALLKMRIGSRLKSIDRLKEFVEITLLYTKIGNDQIPLRPSKPIHTMVDVKLTAEEREFAAKLVSKYRLLLKDDPSRFFSVVFEDFRLLSGRSRILEKTPGHVFLLPIIWKIFPDAKVVFTKRSDKKSILASYYLMTKSRAKVKRASRNFDRLEDIRSEATKNHENSISTLDYDDLVIDPLAQLRVTYRWLGLSEPDRLKNDICDISPKPSKYDLLDDKQKSFIDGLCRGC